MLSGDRTKVADINLIRRAGREGWNIPKEAMEEAGTILHAIAKQSTTTILDGEGKQFEVSNARNQIAAVKALAELDKINQADHWNQDKNDRLDSGKLTENHGIMPAIVEQPIPVKPRD